MRRKTMADFAAAAREAMHTAQVSGELGVAAASTIGLRTAMMAEALADPNGLTNPEFCLMGTEKVEAAAESAQALATGIAEWQQGWAALVTGQAQAALRALTEMGLSRSPAELADAHRHFMETSLSAGMEAGIHFAHSAARLAAAGLAPLHRTASANARRLSRVRG